VIWLVYAAVTNFFECNPNLAFGKHLAIQVLNSVF